MQLTLRDYFWLTIVVGLVIGIVIEHYDVRALRQFEGKAEWWEKAARQMGKRAGEKDGLEPEFKEFSHAGLKNKEGLLIWDASTNLFGRQTNDAEQTIVTGHSDLDFLLLLLFVLMPVGALIGFAIRKSSPTGGKAYSKASVRSYRWLAPGSIVMLLVYCLIAYITRHPFTATLSFTALIFSTGHYWHHARLRLTPELEQQIDDNYEKPVNLGGWLKLGK